jgi:hypothetical protein
LKPLAHFINKTAINRIIKPSVGLIGECSRVITSRDERAWPRCTRKIWHQAKTSSSKTLTRGLCRSSVYRYLASVTLSTLGVTREKCDSKCREIGAKQTAHHFRMSKRITIGKRLLITCLSGVIPESSQSLDRCSISTTRFSWKMKSSLRILHSE